MFFDKINITSIVKSHINTLKNDNSKKPGFDDYLVFLILPISIASALVLFNIQLSDSAINILITSLSIFIGLLFNIIVLMFDIIKRDASKKLKNTILKELLSNISFTILISVVSIIFTLLSFLQLCFLKNITTWIVYFLLSIFLFTVLMILKRMYILFRNELDEIEKKNNT